MDYSAARMARFSPDAKLIFMLRDPVGGAFSAEIMLRNLGVPLDYSFMEDVKPADPRFVETAEDVAYWQQVGGGRWVGAREGGWGKWEGASGRIGGWGGGSKTVADRSSLSPLPCHPLGQTGPPAAPPGLPCLAQVAALQPEDPLPADLMHKYYTSCYALLRSGRYADRIAPFLQHFKREK